MRAALLAVVAGAWLVACGTASDAPATNHTVNIQNFGSNTSTCTARQFTRLRLTPSGGGAAAQYDFVISPNTGLAVQVQLPQSGLYELMVFTSGGQSIFWTDLAMAVGGLTQVSLSTNNVGFFDNSYAAGLHSSGNDITCQ